MRIGIAKLGRSWCMDPKAASVVGGDIDVIRSVVRIGDRRPRDEIVLIGKNSGDDPMKIGYPDNVVNPWHGAWKMPSFPASAYGKEGSLDLVEAGLATFWESVNASGGLHFDAIIVWLGQHGSCSRMLPMVNTRWEDCDYATPLQSMTNYARYLVEIINETGVEPILLVPDPRNTYKMRDITRPFTRPALAQFNESRKVAYEQYGDTPPPWVEHVGSCGVSRLDYVYAGVELCALDKPNKIELGGDGRKHLFGLISNENKKEVTRPRLPLVKEWVIDNWADAPIHGTWSEESQQALGRRVEPIPQHTMYDVLRQFTCTITLPASGSGWATAKPWECFAAGTVCFFHPQYDTQNHVLLNDAYEDVDIGARRELNDFLRVGSPDELRVRVERIKKDKKLRAWLVDTQRRHFERAFNIWEGGVGAALKLL